ncbi:GAF domain-containing sensor histidine kinase [Streptomyces sp. Li-HN-5-11]|uniref:GAF domain-containing sensor histidine kinase n=1 Tax=Streptomyces sp. Li-HN-5-11 TaxID=3075432 RepID=UPI0028AF8B1B|nr:GAF domain-containing sensor histidine kinase [Streptomyces sp. Li-HN-5-11]WNM36594.1 GAF domain-containing sensor histidine kinase [Streptomyces sp. Li-HN-5-11]
MDEFGQEARDARASGALPQLRLDELLEGLQQQVAQVRSARDRVHTLLDAVLAIGSDLELEVVLQRIVESAVSLVDAKYGALGVLGEEGTIKQFVTVGIDEETIARIGHYPHGEGILGLLIRHPEPLRLADLAQHPSSVGFPAGHPPMTSFLGAPVRVRDQVFGNLYLTDKQGTAEFDADDEAVLRTLAAAAGVAIDNARLYDDARRRQGWLAASNELTRSLLSGTEPAVVLESCTATVREMAGADMVTLAVPVGDSGELVVEAASGTRAEDVRGLVLGAGALATKVFASGETITSDAVSADPRAVGGSAAIVELGPAFFVPLGTRDHVRGVLQVANVPGGPVFADAVIDMVIGYGNQAALALEVAEHRQDAERMLVLNDRDRIARDLHDLVIQRLFAGALTLQSTLGRLSDRPQVGERVQRVVDDLDDTIKVIRSTIYSLREQERARSEGLRARLVAAMERASETLGFAPALRMTGLLDTNVPADHAEHLLAVLGEALSNAARHARATAVDVSVEVTDTALQLKLADNGRGVDPTVTRRSGLANLEKRAQELGGTFTIRPNEPSGTVVEWAAPLRAAR